jgi:hypothetical protein
MRITVAVGVALLGMSTISRAQVAQAGPRPGAWGAEVTVSSGATGAGANLLRFRNDRTAWLLGFNAQASKQETTLFSGATYETGGWSVAPRVGIQSLRSPGSTLRPLVGGGILGSFQRRGGDNIWSAGVYGEFGVTRFFGESFSLGAVSEVQLRRFEQEAGESKLVESRVAFDAVRLVAAIYF